MKWHLFSLHIELTYISSFVDCLLMPFAHFPIWVCLIFLLIERAIYILRILFFQLLSTYKIFLSVFHVSFVSFFFFSMPKVYVLCIKAVTFYIRVSVFRVTLERQPIHLHFIFPVILNYTMVLALFSLQTTFLVTFQRFWSESIRDPGNQSRGNMTISSTT